MSKPGSTSRRKILRVAGAAALGAAAYAAGRLHGQGTADNPALLKRSVGQLPRVLDATQRAPNILLVVTDQERAALPRGLPLPAHEWLSERGTTFERWHVNTTPCSPSRSNLYFGQYTQRTGIIANLGVYPDHAIPPDMPSLGHYLRANGYYTAYKGKWHLSDVHARHELTYGHYPNSDRALEPWGFSDFNADGDPHGSTWTGFRTDAQIASQSAQWIRERKRAGSEPWFLAVNLVNPHDVMYYASGAAQIASRGHKDYLAPLSVPPDTPLYRRQWAFDRPANSRDDLSTKPWAHANYREFCDMAYGQVEQDDASWQAYQNYYFNCIADADQHVMTVIAALKDSGQLHNTVIVFTSDHGEMAGAHGLRQKGPFMYDENIRVPMRIVHPDVQGGRSTRALGSAVDLIPTLLQLAGADADRIARTYPQLQGVGVARAVEDVAARTQRDERGLLFNYDTTHYLDSEFIEQLVRRGVVSDKWLPLRALAAGLRPLPRLDRPALFRGIHDGRYKFARYFAAATHHKPLTLQALIANNQLELYDIQTDPHELNNLAHGLTDAPAQRQALVMMLNEKLNRLIETEVGMDLGDELPGPAFMKRL